MIKVVSFEQCMRVWSTTWQSMSSPILPQSCMRLPSRDELNNKPGMFFYSLDIDTPVFLGIHEDKKLVAVNSFHRVDGTTRTRGLFVLPEYRGRGYGMKLLRDTWNRSVVFPVWDFPTEEELPVYLKAGFRQVSGPLEGVFEGDTNYYVTR